MRSTLVLLSGILNSIFSFAQQPRLVLPVGHTDLVLTAKLSTDGKKAVTASSDRTAKLWDANSGDLLADLARHTSPVNCAVFSHDDRKIVTAGDDNLACVWSATTGKWLLDLKGHTGGVLDAEFSPDDKKIVTGSRDSVARIWDAVTGKLLMEMHTPAGRVFITSFSGDGERVLTQSGDTMVNVWDAATGKSLLEIRAHSDPVYSASFSPDGKKIVTSSDDKTARVWDSRSGELLLTLTGHNLWVRSASFSPDNKKIVTSSYDGTATTWDAENGRILTDMIVGITWVYNARFSPDGTKIILNPSTYSPELWDAVTGKLILKLEGHTQSINDISFSRDGKKIISCSDDKTIKIWDVESGAILTELKNHSAWVKSATFSPDGNKMVAFTWKGNSRVWDLTTGVLQAAMTGHNNTARVVMFSPDAKKLLTGSEDETAKIWDAQSGNLLLTIENYNPYAKAPGFAPDGSRLAIPTRRQKVNVIETNTGKLLAELKGHGGWINVSSSLYSPDGKWIATVSDDYDDSVKLWNAANGELQLSMGGHAKSISALAFSPDGKKLVTGSADHTAITWDLATGKALQRFTGHTDKIKYVRFSANGKIIYTAADDGFVKSWEADKGRPLFSFGKHTTGSNDPRFSPDDKRAITFTVYDSINSISTWDLQNGKRVNRIMLANLTYFGDVRFADNKMLVVRNAETKLITSKGVELVSFISVDSTQYVAKTPDGYYRTTPDAAKLLHYVTGDLQVITFEQLDVKYNRPDIILRRLGNTDLSLINSYRKAWEKRIKKLGIDTTQFREGYSVPVADFTNRQQISYEQTSGEISLSVRGVDSSYRLDRFNIWVNETPLFGQKGIRITKANSKQFDTTLTIRLSQGINRLETSLTNVNGTESYRIPLLVKYTPAMKQKEMTRFIGIGIDRFADSQYNLQYSAKDIRDLSLKLKEKFGDNIIIDTLFNEEVTTANVRALKQKIRQTTEHDKVIVAYSGHGLLSKDFDYYLSTYAIDFNKPEVNGLPYDELENLLDSIPARKKLMLIDACHSGEVDKDDLVRLNGASKSLQKGFKPVAYKKEGRLGLENSFELMQSLFVNVGKSTGATVISAAAGTQFALERNDLRNGVFTFAILEAMKTYPKMKISELKKIVGERVMELTDGLQKPTSRNETIAVDWNIWE